MQCQGDITCPKCERIIRPPFRACQQEHLVCPICKQHQDFVNGSIVECVAKVFQMQLLNKLFINTKAKCQYGCGFKTNYVELEKHEQVCVRHDKLVNCMISHCSWYSVLSKLGQHVYKDHPTQLIDITSEEQKIITLDNPIYLLTQFDKNSLDNELYWLRLYNMGADRYVVMFHLGRTNALDETDRTLSKYSISSIDYDELIVKAKIIKDEDYENIINDDFVQSKGTRITPLEGYKYIIKAKKSQKNLVETMLSRSCCVCTESLALNHRCEPNCQSQKWKLNGDTRVGLVALKDISAGTELTFSSESICVNQNCSSCTCGAPLCPGYKGVRRRLESNEEIPQLSSNILTRRATSTPSGSNSIIDSLLPDISNIIAKSKRTSLPNEVKSLLKDPGALPVKRTRHSSSKLHWSQNPEVVERLIESRKILSEQKRIKSEQRSRLIRQSWIRRKQKMAEEQQRALEKQKEEIEKQRALNNQQKPLTENNEELSKPGSSNKEHDNVDQQPQKMEVVIAQEKNVEVAKENNMKKKAEEEKLEVSMKVNGKQVHNNLKDFSVQVEHISLPANVVSNIQVQPKPSNSKPHPAIPKIKLKMKQKKIVNPNAPKRRPGRPRIHPEKIGKGKGRGRPVKIKYNILPSQLGLVTTSASFSVNGNGSGNVNPQIVRQCGPIKQEPVLEPETSMEVSSKETNEYNISYVPQIKLEPEDSD